MDQMKYSLLGLVFCFLLQLQISNSTTESFCPNLADLSPCQCSNSSVYGESEYNIKCLSNQTFDLALMFANISKDPRVLNTTFNELYLADNTITELPKGTIGQLKFKKIIVSYLCSKLKRIHQQAFESSIKTTRILWIDDLDIDNNATRSVFGLVNSFERLGELRIYKFFPVLQDRVFSENLTSLTTLELAIAELKGSPFYNLPSLSTINLYLGKMSYISSNSFKFKKRDAVSLYINLGGNNLNDSSFEKGAFMNINGSVYLKLIDNQITYLNEQVFGPFLNAHQDNRISLFNNPINCFDCRLFWVLKNKKLKGQILNAHCNGMMQLGTIWENEAQFREQCKHNSTTQTPTLIPTTQNPPNTPDEPSQLLLIAFVLLFIISPIICMVVARKKVKNYELHNNNDIADNSGQSFFFTRDEYTESI